ncbi:hypothetical protein ABZ691_26975 [Streptomyces sp. NPDC006854]|uniref:hypothetical protein n=1 Tax=Streptomyces sp. NPDC006854 TaxID=3155115 RepID=UPI0033FCB705
MAAEQDPGSDIGHSRAVLWRENGPDERGAGMPMLAGKQNVVHNNSRDSGLASWHDEAPERALVSWRNLMLNRSAGGNRTGNPFGKLGKSFPVSEGRSS